VAEQIEGTTVSKGIGRYRRWVVHLVWLIVTGLAFAYGIKLGFHSYFMTLGSMQISNDRASRLGEIASSLFLLEVNDLDIYRRGADWRLRDSVVGMQLYDRYRPCTTRERKVLDDARAYLATHAYKNNGAAEDPFAFGYTAGLDACQGPEKPYPSFFTW
jgi:hypothetical protein